MIYLNEGLLIYGYEKDDADIIYNKLSSLFEQPPFLKTASGKESETIETILDSSDDSFFEEDETKIVMFINMTDSSIQQILNSFPSSVPRPIFCGLTQHNITWPFHELKTHLLKEQAYWEKQKNNK